MSQTFEIENFELKKNTKALSYTALICGIFLLIAILYTWPLQYTPKPVAQDAIEINLGNELEGMGDVQPLIKGDPAPEVPEQKQSEKVAPVQQQTSKDIQADDEDKDAAPLTKPLKPKNDAREVAKQVMPASAKTSSTTPVLNNNPAPQKPKIALYKGGSGTGGNGADQDNGYRNQGYKPGTGDNGSPTGKPDSYGNTPGGRSGVSVIKGLSGRRPIRFPSMEDDFNENAKVYVDIKVDASGAVVSAVIARGTTTSNGSLRNIALQKARQLKFPSSQNDEESGTILFNFKLRD